MFKSEIALADGFEKQLLEYERYRGKRGGEYRLTLTHARVLRYLLTHGDSKEKDLRLAEAMNASSLARALSKLHNDGLVLSRIEAEDRRQRILSVTESGRDRLRLWDEKFGFRSENREASGPPPGHSGNQVPSASEQPDSELPRKPRAQRTRKRVRVEDQLPLAYVE